jgi:excisionase family DNA binding protein
MPEQPQTSAPIAPAVLTPEEAASYIRVGKTKLFELIKAGEIPAKRYGERLVRIKVSDLDAWVDAQPNARAL